MICLVSFEVAKVGKMMNRMKMKNTFTLFFMPAAQDLGATPSHRNRAQRNKRICNPRMYLELKE